MGEPVWRLFSDARLGTSSPSSRSLLPCAIRHIVKITGQRKPRALWKLPVASRNFSADVRASAVTMATEARGRLPLAGSLENADGRVGGAEACAW
ncbi:hypothetical protein chiPu_0004997 [Chiloscyllium punctatum]|uniref:Uncharacterized protein n=1 Tax=Chiloscyllium punctatum TaxID=137246 RepID=A0A401S8A9_CHIPU|nr:hypothetical protein [Chiloscyllium punctatum]